MKGKVALHNLGCKVNAYETEAMQQMLEAAGYEIVPFEPGADIYVINTCTVTNIADRKSRQMLHKAKKMNPDAIVVAAGCYVQADTKKAEADASIDIIIGNNKKQELISILENYRSDQQKTTECVDINHTKEYEKLEIDRTEEHTRAYLKVQDGCNQFCTYCMIPYARGRIRSKKTEDVVGEVKRLAASGCQEVVLTGIHLSSYGKERPEEQENLLTLILTAWRSEIRIHPVARGLLHIIGTGLQFFLLFLHTDTGHGRMSNGMVANLVALLFHSFYQLHIIPDIRLCNKKTSFWNLCRIMS